MCSGDSLLGGLLCSGLLDGSLLRRCLLLGHSGLGGVLGSACSLGSSLGLALGLLGLLGSCSGSGLGSLLGGLLLLDAGSGATELVGKALDASTGVDELLLTGDEGMALVSELDDDLALGGVGLEGVAARAANGALHVLGMNVGLH